MSVAGIRPDRAAGSGTPPVSRLQSAVLFTSIVAGNFLVILDVSILNVALPNVKKDLHATAAQLPWTVDAYTVVFAGLLLASGAVADRFGPRRIYRFALGLFAVLSLACAAAPNAETLIIARALQGAAAAGLVPASLALLAALYPEPARRARAVGTWAAMSSIGFAAGPVLGGALVDSAGWRWVFLVNPLIVLLAALPSRGLSSHRPTSYRAIDRPGLVLSIVGLAAVTYYLIEGGTTGWGRPLPLTVLGVGIVAMVLLAVVERKAEAPVLPPRLLALGRVRADLVAGAMASFVFYGPLFGLTLWMIRERGYSPFHAGLAFLPMTLPAAFLPMLAGRAVVRFGSRTVILIGFAISVLGGLGLMLAGANPPMPLLVASEIALTIGGTTVIPACTADMSSAAPAELAATAMGALSGSRQAGVALGVAVLGTVTTLRLMGLTITLAAAASLLLIAWLRRGSDAGAPVGGR